MAIREDDPKTVMETRRRYYQGLSEGLTPEQAAARAQGKPLPKVVLQPKPVTAAPIVPHPALATSDEEFESASEPMPDDLTRIQGIGPSTNKKLNGLGITTIAQIAAWTPEEAAEFDKKLGLRGRIVREDWITKAKALT